MVLDRCFQVSSFPTMGRDLWAASCQGAAQPSTGQRSGEVGWRPIRRLAAGHAGRRRGAAAFGLHGELVAFRRLCSCDGAECAEQFKKQSDGIEVPGGYIHFGRFSMA